MEPGVCGLNGGFPPVSPTAGQILHVLLTRPPLELALSSDLHVLGAPPAFVLSQDQTLHDNSGHRAQALCQSQKVIRLTRLRTVERGRSPRSTACLSSLVKVPRHRTCVRGTLLMVSPAPMIVKTFYSLTLKSRASSGHRDWPSGGCTVNTTTCAAYVKGALSCPQHWHDTCTFAGGRHTRKRGDEARCSCPFRPIFRSSRSASVICAARCAPSSSGATARRMGLRPSCRSRPSPA